MIEVNGKPFQLFCDSGCESSCIHKNAADSLGDCTVQVSLTSMKIGRFRQSSSTAEHGLFRFKLPMADSRDTVMTGPAIDFITENFPTFPLMDVYKEALHFSDENRITMRKWPGYTQCVENLHTL